MSGTISATAATLIAAALGAGGAGLGFVENIKSNDQSAANQAANAKALLQQQQASANQANLSKQEAVMGAQGQTQAQTGGSLTDSGTASLTDLLAGYPGYQAGSSGSSSTNSGTSTGTGVGTSGVSNGAASPAADSGSGSPDITAILAALRNGASGAGAGGPGSSSISGGNWQVQPAQPQSYQQLANPVL